MTYTYRLMMLLLIAALTLGCGDDGGDDTNSGEDGEPENSEAACSDGIDNDGDGATDEADAECKGFIEEVPDEWVTTWVSAQQVTETGNLPPAPGLAGSTLRQKILVSQGGSQVRVTFSNFHGNDPLTIRSAGVALSAGGFSIEADSHTPLTFSGETEVTIDEDRTVTSDPVELEVPPLTVLAVSMYLDDEIPLFVTGHPGSRTYSYLVEGDAVADERLDGASQTPHWYFLSAVDVLTDADARAVVILGDSITDGYASTTDKNNRWPNALDRRLQENESTPPIAVLNQGIGGNCVTNRCGLGPAFVNRFESDVLEPVGVTRLILFGGVNDMGQGVKSDALIDAFTELAEKAHDADLEVIGATVMPCSPDSYYACDEFEDDRQALNEWIRTTELYHAVIDFDEITRDPDNPTEMRPDIDSGDGLHPDGDGYQIMAEGIDLTIFESSE